MLAHQVDHVVHRLHAIQRGPDGWLYVLCGNNTGIDRTYAELPTSPVKEPIAGCVLRFQPDLKKCEIVAHGFFPPRGEAYHAVENPKGELGFYLISDGGPNPYRYRIRPPSFINITILEDMCLGHTVADAVIILGSVDIVLGEVDR